MYRSTGHMENGIGVFGVPIQYLHGFFRWEDEQFNFAPPSLTSDLIHDWQCPGARAHHQPTALPRYLLFQRERRAAHFFNFLLLSLLVRSGLEILSARPRLYWSSHNG